MNKRICPVCKVEFEPTKSQLYQEKISWGKQLNCQKPECMKEMRKSGGFNL